jgi:hypothetical protein
VSFFRALCWVPAALWIWARAVAGRYDGWGAWAAAPLLLVPVAVSFLFVGTGFLLVGRPVRGGRHRGDWIAIGVAALPVLWIALRILAAP